MFSLDNKSIQYPFAVHERVPVGTTALANPRLSELILIVISSSLGGFLRRSHSLPNNTYLVGIATPWCTKNPSYRARPLGRPNAYDCLNGYHQERCWKASA